MLDICADKTPKIRGTLSKTTSQRLIFRKTSVLFVKYY